MTFVARAQPNGETIRDTFSIGFDLDNAMAFKWQFTYIYTVFATNEKDQAIQLTVPSNMVFVENLVGR